MILHYDRGENLFLPTAAPRRFAAGGGGWEEEGAWIGRTWCRITGSTETSSAVA